MRTTIRMRKSVLSAGVASLLILAGTANAQPFHATYSAGVSSPKWLTAVKQVYYTPTATPIDDGFITVGRIDRPGIIVQATPDWYAVRTQQNGSVVWSRRLADGELLSASVVGATSVDVLSDGSFVVVGEALRGDPIEQPTLGVLRLSASGSVLWSLRLPSDFDGFANEPVVAALGEDTIGVVGNSFYTSLSGIPDGPTYFQLDTSGNVLSAVRFQIDPGLATRLQFRDIKYDAATNTVVVVGSGVQAAGSDAFGVVLRLQPDGTLVNLRAFDFYNISVAQVRTEGLCIEPLGGGELAIAGTTDLYDLGGDTPVVTSGTWVCRLNSSLIPIWKSVLSTGLPPGQGFTPSPAGLRLNGNVLGLAGNFVDPISNLTASLGRWSTAATFQGVSMYEGPLGNYSTRALGLSPVLQSAGVTAFDSGWAIAGSWANSDPFLIRGRLSGLTGCELPYGMQVVDPFLSDFPIEVETTYPGFQGEWTVEAIALQHEREFLCAPTPCGIADVTGLGGPPSAPDGMLTIEDFLAFLDAYGSGDGCPGAAPCTLADITGLGGPPALPDGELTIDDFLAFLAAFGDGCGS